MTAVVTGARTGIGAAVARHLLEEGYHVYGLSRRIAEAAFDTDRFTPVECDLSDPHRLETACKTLQNLPDLSLLVNAAGFGRFDPHETLSQSQIISMTAVNLTAPMLLSNLFLPTLKRHGGTIINITSIEALRASRFSAVYSATKAGLRAFGQSLFEEVRKSGVNIVTINPDMTDTPFFDQLRFGVSDAEDTRLETADIVAVIDTVLSMRPGAAVTEVTIRPQRFGIEKNKR